MDWMEGSRGGVDGVRQTDGAPTAQIPDRGETRVKLKRCGAAAEGFGKHLHAVRVDFRVAWSER